MPLTMTLAEAMEEIRRLAPIKDHKLAGYLLDGRALTEVQAGLVLENLRNAPALSAPAGNTAHHQARNADVVPQTGNVPPPLASFKGKIPFPEGAKKLYFATPGEGGTVNFWKVEPGKGKWEGYIFPRRILGGDAQAGEEMRTVELNNMQKRLALAAILDYGLDEAGNLFADKLTRCRDCGRWLTDEVSRAERRGPDCRSKH